MSLVILPWPLGSTRRFPPQNCPSPEQVFARTTTTDANNHHGEGASIRRRGHSNAATWLAVWRSRRQWAGVADKVVTTHMYVYITTVHLKLCLTGSTSGSQPVSPSARPILWWPSLGTVIHDTHRLTFCRLTVTKVTVRNSRISSGTMEPSTRLHQRILGCIVHSHNVLCTF